MTTFLLHGGATSKQNENNNQFFKQLVELVPKNEVHVVLCYWARPKDEHKQLISRDSETISNQTNKHIIFHTAVNPSHLSKLLEACDALYVAGGDDQLIEPYYKELDFLKDKLKNKIYAGSSMGAFLVSESYVLSYDSQDDNSVHTGVGLLPIQILCHWDVETKKQQKITLLTNYSDKPIISLDECNFVTLYN